jgi:hypothetical protein
MKGGTPSPPGLTPEISRFQEFFSFSSLFVKLKNGLTLINTLTVCGGSENPSVTGFFAFKKR